MARFKQSPFKQSVPAAAPAKPASVLIYKATCVLPSNKIPTKVFLFPPLRSDAKGNPVETLKPVQDSEGNIIDWRSSGSGSSKPLQQVIAKELRKMGYEIIDFQTVVNARVPYSILIVSSFYTSENLNEDSAKNGLDRNQTVMIKGGVFDVDLDPQRKIDLLKVDGRLNYSSGNKPSQTLVRTFQESLRWLGDNVEGFLIVD